MNGLTRIVAFAAIMGAASAAPALAHTGIGAHGNGLVAGFAHPLMGLDHMLAMLGIGVWAAQLGRRAGWLVPAAFVAVMIGGAALALSGAALPMVEFGIAGSVLVIGGLIAFSARMSLGLAMGLVGAFAVFHGFAHGTELPGFAHPAAYGAGFVAATALLHAAGFAIACVVHRHATKMPFRFAGAAMGAVGGGLLLGA
ncbi:HupE/UreJ family protein [Dongia deserti]|uniref:HupE/UreJ family protein n=1 Tax=Dongia deserti TaxID=2268030 RepID=UPI0025474242|nr:HupE/UreJ family protein [Dongia deserti]